MRTARLPQNDASKHLFTTSTDVQQGFPILQFS